MKKIPSKIIKYLQKLHYTFAVSVYQRYYILHTIGLGGEGLGQLGEVF